MSATHNLTGGGSLWVKILECSLCSRSIFEVCRELTNCETISEDFQPVWSWYVNVTNRRMDRRLAAAIPWHHMVKIKTMRAYYSFVYWPTCPLLLKPRISWLMLDVRPDWISWRWRNRLRRARPRPLSNSPWVSTPSTVLLPASTLPSTASRMSMNYSAHTSTNNIINIFTSYLDE